MSTALRLLRENYKRFVPEKARAFAWTCLLSLRRLRARPLHLRKPHWPKIQWPTLSRPVEQNSCSLYHWHIAQATVATQALDSQRSLLHLNACAKENPEDWEICHRRGIIQLQLVGDLDEAMKQFAAARGIRERSLPRGIAKPPYRFLDAFWGYQIGHIANTEHLIKREILRGRDPKNLIMYFPADANAGNHALLNKMAELITLISDERDLPQPRSVMTSVMEEYYVCESLDGRLKHWWHASPEIFGAWEQNGRKPLLSLSAAEVAEGRKALAKLGLPNDAWFVALHVREGGFKAAQGYGAIESVLNANIDSYISAIRSITERGGWVIRIGDDRMLPITPMANVIDYARSPAKSEATDLFILGRCRFYIGTSSGPAYVPPLFGIPCVLTNWAPTGQRPFNQRDLYIFKIYDDPASPDCKSDARAMKFHEFLSPPVGYAGSSEQARSLRVVMNTPEEIQEVVEEMLLNLDGQTIASAGDQELRARFDKIATSSRCIGNARVGIEFLRRHVSRL